MPIPGDPENREWIELSGVNRDQVDQFRPTLISFLASDKDHQTQAVGTGFLIGAGPDVAIVLTAKHVLTPGVLNVQKPRLGHAPSTLAEFLPKSATQVSLDPKQLVVIWANSHKALHQQIVHCGYNESSDLAVCLLVKPPGGESIFPCPCIPLCTEIPQVGEIVHMVSYDKLELNTLEPVTQSAPGLFSLHRAVSIRRGYVTNVHREGYRQYKWPCITTSIPAEPGMSGGFLFIPREGTTIAASGVICADNSDEISRSNQMHAGESVIGLGYMALALMVPTQMDNAAPLRSLQQMMSAGHLTPAVGGFEQFTFLID
ncbi:MAG: trypsin-like peptidase domain-containing protein [Burkholderiales bacterium]|nr:trypsin-like peptidase domain-containing protein [Burkholderiales bacterium]